MSLREMYEQITTARCRLCGRKLTVPKSIMRGYGPVCYKKIFEGIILDEELESSQRWR